MPDLGEKGWEPLGVAFRRVEAERDEARRQLANLRAAVMELRNGGNGHFVTLRCGALLADPACGGPE